MKATKENETIFVDKDGNEWSRGCLQDLIDAVRAFHEVMDTAKYYSFRFKDRWDDEVLFSTYSMA